MVEPSTSDTVVNKEPGTGAATQFVPRITAISGPGAGRVLAMTHVMATAGRHATNDLVVTDPGVSGVHLELRRGERGLHVRDAGSTNGTWLGAHRITEIELGPSAELTIGTTVLRIDTDAVAIAGMSPAESFGELVGRSAAMREIFGTLERVAGKPLGILFQGEGGTGKEEMARAVVARGPRAQASFVVVDVTSVPESLLDPLLFGQEKTASVEMAPGVFEANAGGTVLIDEVGRLPVHTQAKLLRVLERQELTRVGGHVPVKVDVRILASTSRDLRHEIEADRFREDLYFRLAQVRVVVPSLRERIEDLGLLATKLLQTVAGGAGPLTIAEDAMAQLASQPWPGNVRELRNALERGAALSRDGVIRRSDLAGEGVGIQGSRGDRDPLDLSGNFRDAKERAIERFESAYLASLMRRCNGNVSLASRESDIARHHLRDLLKKRELYGISWDKLPDSSG
jgi:DNA-binding NtrC family response regulator